MDLEAQAWQQEKEQWALWKGSDVPPFWQYIRYWHSPYCQHPRCQLPF